MITQAEYDQVSQEALNPSSAINTAGADAILVALDFHGVPFDVSLSSNNSEAPLEYLKMIGEGLSRGAAVPVIWQTIVCPPAPLFGSLDARVQGSLRRQIMELNEDLREFARSRGDFVIDIAAVAEAVGTQNWQDPVQWNLYKLPFAQGMVPLYVEHVGRLLGAIRGTARKCLVLDLDNTVWGGVIGDDGMDGIAIGQGDGIAEAHLDIQRTALALRERGIVLAVCSKNNDDVARQPFREHPDMLLREEHIAVFQANWNDKASNLEAIAKTLNIGLDALVFLDDNPVERKQVREALPMVAVPELPQDPSLYARTLLNAGYFETVAFSDDDRARAAQYQANAQRAELASGARNMDEFLLSLDMRIELIPFNSVSYGRVTQLINKTNQFNLTTRRYTQAEVEEVSRSRDHFTLQVRLLDRFGDNGIIAIVIGKQTCEEAELDTWLMSCRVLGRRVEEAMMAEIVRYARRRGVKTLVGSFIPSLKNAMVKDHYAKLAFKPAGSVGDTELWRLVTSDYAEPALPFEFIDSNGAGPPAKAVA
jgi:FkbH-like protein